MKVSDVKMLPFCKSWEKKYKNKTGIKKKKKYIKKILNEPPVIILCIAATVCGVTPTEYKQKGKTLPANQLR